MYFKCYSQSSSIYKLIEPVVNLLVINYIVKCHKPHLDSIILYVPLINVNIYIVEYVIAIKLNDSVETFISLKSNMI